MVAVASAPAAQFPNHVEQRTVVLPALRVLFVPVPKAGCTSVLWLLAELAGEPLERFGRSTLAEPSPALTIHDMSLWSAEHRLSGYDGRERERMLTEDGWLRFSLVRHPATRLWSAWQSKLLLREPRFVEAFGDEPWFPRVPHRAFELVEDFRRFVHAVAAGAAEDVHWAVQHELVESLPLTHIGRVERIEETLDLLRAHMPGDWGTAPRENRSRVPLPPHAFGEGERAALEARYGRDLEAFGYDLEEPREPETEGEWELRVDPLVPLLRDTIEQNVRIAQLHRVARRVRTAEEKLEAVSVRQLGRRSASVISNREGHADFNVRWGWEDGDLQPGFTAVLRVKDEAASLPWVLPPLLRAVTRVVMIDNGSTDGSAAVARRVAAAAGAAERLEVLGYPFAVARCGTEHLSTPVDSVHSLAHFYNWSFSHVRTTYALKWDGDMVLSDLAVAALRDLAWQLEGTEAIVRIPRHSLYVDGDRRAALDAALRNCEPWAWPNRPGYGFGKALEWELPLWRDGVDTVELPEWSCIELKHLRADEFAHWSHTNFTASARTRRKQREWEISRALGAGARPPAGVEAIAAPAGVHVIDYVRAAWLPARAASATSAASP